VSTATPEQLVSRPDRGTVFLSRRGETRLVMTPKRAVYGPDGRTGEMPGQTLRFVDNRLYVPDEGEVTLEDGNKVDATVIRAFLDKHRLNGDIEDGFWPLEVPAPSISGDELAQITDAALEFDEERLAAIIMQERDGWARADLLGVAEGALAKMRDAKAKLAEQQAAAKPAPKAKAAARSQED
jgi:hypothetical protein